MLSAARRSWTSASLTCLVVAALVMSIGCRSRPSGPREPPPDLHFASVAVASFAFDASGEGVVDAYYPWARQQLEATFGVPLTDDARVAAAEGYRALPVRAGTWRSVPPLLALTAADDNGPLLAALAAEVDVDALVVMDHRFATIGKNMSARRRVCDRFTVTIFNRDGRRAFVHKEGMSSEEVSTGVGLVREPLSDKASRQLRSQAFRGAFHELNRVFTADRDQAIRQQRLRIKRGRAIYKATNCGHDRPGQQSWRGSGW